MRNVLAMMIVIVTVSSLAVAEVPGWHGFVLVKERRSRLGFLLSQFDPHSGEAVVSSDDTMADVDPKASAHGRVYEVPEAFGSIVKEIVVQGHKVTGIVKLPNCTFTIVADPLPWMSTDKEEQGQLFHLPLPQDEKSLLAIECPFTAGAPKIINTSTKH